MINLPNNYIRVNSIEGDPKDSIPFMYENSSSRNFIMTYPIDIQKSMPFDDKAAIIKGIHNSLSEGQGLIEINNGETINKSRYVYSIVKTLRELSGVQYCLTLNLLKDDKVLFIQGFFDELGITGLRDTIITNKLINEGKINPLNKSAWMSDPYDKEYNRGVLMNLSESADYDNQFIGHPLTEARRLVNFIIQNN